MLLLMILGQYVSFSQNNVLKESKKYTDGQTEKIRLEHQKLFRDMVIAKLRSMN